MSADPHRELAVGSTIGKFKLLANAGVGGMGVVWKAEDTTLGRVIALKFLPESVAQSPQARRRFLREARAAGRLSHPGIAAVFEAGELDRRLFIAIQWIDGETVADLLARGPLKIPDALRIARDAADALAHAHAHGVLHRDVSARNLMVRRDGQATLLDFGLALPEGTSRITSSNSTIGTMPYLAPELILGGKASERSDVYGLGAVLYEMLAGKPPFSGERPEAILYAAVNEPLEAPSRRCPGIPVEVDQITRSALERVPQARCGSAAELAAALRAIEPGEQHRLPEALPGGPRVSSRPLQTPGAHGPSMVGPPPRYLAVLPFRNLQIGNDAKPNGDFFALGVSDTVSAQLARYSGVLVVSALETTLGPDPDVREFARSCGADVVLRGTVQQSGERLRIAFSVVDPLQGIQLAGDVLDGALSEVFLMQDQLARRVAEVLRPEAMAVTTLPDRIGLNAVAAKERYLQALGYLQRHDNEAQVDGALSLLGDLRDGGDDSALVEAALGRACVYKYQMTRDAQWELRAEEACRRAIELDPRSPEMHMTLGNAQRISGQYVEAVRSFRRALKLRPDHPDALTGLAGALESAGKLEEAEETYLRAIALRPGFWESYHLLGSLCWSQGRYERSVQLWTRVTELTPDNARAFYNLGGAYFRLERFEDAIATFNRSISIRPEASAYSNLGTVHYFLGHWSEAAAMFERAVALRPRTPRLWGNLGDACRAVSGRDAEARSAYDRAIELMRAELKINPKRAESLGWLAEWLARRGEFREARLAVRRALKLAPKDLDIMARAVNVFHLAGDRGEALHWIEAAVTAGYGLAEFERDPDLAPLRQDLTYKEIAARFKTPAPKDATN